VKYCVTGATGFIGGRLARELAHAGHTVHALVRSPERGRPLEELGVKLFKGDITIRDSIQPAMEGVDGVFHVAAYYHIGNTDIRIAERVNVQGTRNVLETMRNLGIAKGVYTSTIAIFSDTHGRLPDESYYYDGKHLSAYDHTKWEAHYEVALPMIEEGLPLVIVQPGAVYGPGDTSELGQALRDFVRGDLPILPSGNAYCWTHVDDAAHGHVLAMEKGRDGESYIVAGPPHSLEEALAVAGRIAGRPLPRVRIPPLATRAMSALVRPLEHLIHLPPAYTSEGLRVSAGVTYLASNDKAQRELGYRPRSLEQGLTELIPKLLR
jgi:nucleoside-diphosphate-sugar epimerase